MSTIKPVQGGKHAGPSARDLTPYQWRAAKFTGSASSGDTATLETDQTIDVAGAGDHVVGVIEYPGDAAGRPTTIITLATGKVQVGETVKAGDRLKAGTDGVGLKAASGDKYFCTVKEGGPSGAIVPIDFDHGVA